MDERELRQWIQRVKDGTITRRQFTRTMVGLGLTAPLAAQMLAVRRAWRRRRRSPPSPRPSAAAAGRSRRSGGRRRPPNPHFAAGTKDQDGSRIFYEPLASFDPDGNLVPILAAEMPTLQNGGIAKDGTSVTWRLKKNVQWHDGKPFTADDVVFNWEYAADPATAAVTVGDLQGHRADRQARQPHRQDRVQPAGAVLVRRRSAARRHDHPEARLRAVQGREVPRGAGQPQAGRHRAVPVSSTSSPATRSGRELNPNYHVPNRPFFDTVELKGGGDAASAARAVLQTGEYDYAWNMQVEDDILQRLEQGGKGQVEIASGRQHRVHPLQPRRSLDARSTGSASSLKSKHPAPHRSRPSARRWPSWSTGAPSRSRSTAARARPPPTSSTRRAASSRRTRSGSSTSTRPTRSSTQAGWKRGADGIRAKDGKRLKIVYQTSINPPRQKTQAIVKQAARRPASRWS